MSLDAGAPVDLSEELVRRLRHVGRAVRPRELGELWIFPPLEDVEESAEFLLFTRMTRGGRRRLYSARMGREAVPAEGGEGDAGSNGRPAADPGGGERRQRITDHGSIPADRVPRLVERFRRRVEADGHEPVHVVVEGTLERWRALLPGEEVPGDGSGPAGNGSGPAGNGTEPDDPGYEEEDGAGPTAA